MSTTKSSERAVRLYRFGPYEADLLRNELRKFGLRVRLEPKPWLLMVALLERPGELITRGELQQALWGKNVSVDFEHGLNVAVKKLRAALCDPAGVSCYIETVVGEGYRFLAHVEFEGLNSRSVESENPAAILRSQNPRIRLGWVTFCALAALCIIIFSFVSPRIFGRVGAGRIPGGRAQTRRFVYVPDYSRNAVLGYSVNPTKGTLEPVASGPFNSGEHPYYAIFTPDRDALYVANRGRSDGACGNGCTISGYAIDHVSGALVELAGSPFPAGSGPVAMAFHPSGKFLYVANVISNDLQAYARTTDGRLTFNGPPVSVGTHPFYVGIDASGRFLYVTNQDDATISAFSIDPKGVPHKIAGSPYATGLRPRSFTIHPSGRFAYVVNYGVNPYLSRDAACSGNYGSSRGKGCTISVFSIDRQTGSLSEVKGSPFRSDGTNPISSAMDSHGKFLFVANITSNDVSVFRVNSTDGTIQALRGSPFAAPYGPAAVALDWSGEFLYVVSAYSQSVAQFTIDGDSGRLRTIGPPLRAGVGPVSIVAPLGSLD